MEGPIGARQPHVAAPKRVPLDVSLPTTGTRCHWVIVLVALLLGLTVLPASAARLSEFLPRVQPGEIFPGADRVGPPQGDPPLAPVYAGDRPSAMSG